MSLNLFEPFSFRCLSVFLTHLGRVGVEVENFSLQGYIPWASSKTWFFGWRRELQRLGEIYFVIGQLRSRGSHPGLLNSGNCIPTATKGNVNIETTRQHPQRRSTKMITVGHLINIDFGYAFEQSQRPTPKAKREDSTHNHSIKPRSFFVRQGHRKFGKRTWRP